ncbi:uncharacterized protein LOC142980645 [Anticarsia gemmatalis]|uniref:uncharacterized protein LOC142980645 n=1 Tax=Anticarsia gemmatalis TaxID=129554 RepID=UPI003F76B8DA
MFPVLLFCLFVFLPRDISAKKTIEIDVKKSSYKEEVYEVSKNFKIKLIDKKISEVQCSSQFYGYQYATALYLDEEDSIIKVSTVTDEMSDVWQCLVKDIESDKDENIFFEIRVPGAKPPQTVLVNNVVVPTRRDPNDRNSHLAEYYYVKEDRVHVACVNTFMKDNSEINLTYQYLNSTEKPYEQMSSEYRVGFSTTLQAKHNNSKMYCEFSRRNNQIQRLQVTFLLQKNTNVMNLIINEATVRGTRVESYDSYMIYSFQYAYFNDEDTITLNCERDENLNKDIRMRCKGCTNSSATDSSNIIYEWFKPKDISRHSLISIDAHENMATDSQHSLLERFQIGIVQLNAGLNEFHKLEMTGLPLKNIVIQLYGSNIQTIYYEFTNEEHLTLTCSKNIDKHYLIFDDEKSLKEEMFISKSITINKSHHNLTTSCYLSKTKTATANTIKEQIQVIFRIKGEKYAEVPTTESIPTSKVSPTTPITSTMPIISSTTTITSTTTIISSTTTEISSTEASRDADSGVNWVVVAVGILMLIIVITICAVVYRMVRRKRQMQRIHDYENVCLNNDSAIPPYPKQWENDYAVPNLFPNSKGDEVPIDGLYAKPIPKNQRLKNVPETFYSNVSSSQAILEGRDSDALYAEPVNTDPTYSNQGVNKVVTKVQGQVLYTEVVPKSMRPTYANVSKQNVKSNNLDYAEPTYSLPINLY